MRYAPIDSSLFIGNRNKFGAMLKPKSLAIFNSNDIMPTSADGTMPFIQQTDFFYLSGIDQEESILILFPDAIDKQNQEILFIKETNEEISIWEGHKYSMEEAREISGIQSIYWITQFEEILNTLLVQVNTVYLNSNEHLRARNLVETRDMRFFAWFEKRYSLYKLERAQPILHNIRPVKSELEINQIREAIKITEK